MDDLHSFTNFSDSSFINLMTRVHGKHPLEAQLIVNFLRMLNFTSIDIHRILADTQHFVYRVNVIGPTLSLVERAQKIASAIVGHVDEILGM